MKVYKYYEGIYNIIELAQCQNIKRNNYDANDRPVICYCDTYNIRNEFQFK